MRLFRTFLLATGFHLSCMVLVVVQHHQMDETLPSSMTRPKPMFVRGSIVVVQTHNSSARDQMRSRNTVIPDSTASNKSSQSPGFGATQITTRGFIEFNHTQYWRFDAAAPNIVAGTTHFLQSIPQRYRISHSSPTFDMLRYVQQPQNVWPQKLHLHEMNPCIAVLPSQYRSMFHDVDGIDDDDPVYVVAYRVTHQNNCHEEHTQRRLLGDYKEPLPKTDFLGLALLRRDLSIVSDTVVDIGGQNGDASASSSSKFNSILPIYNDFRIFNLHDRLYLSTANRVVPLYLTINSSGELDRPPPDIPEQVVAVPPAFSEGNAVSTPPPFQVWIRNHAACPVYGYAKNGPKRNKKSKNSTAKNLLYFLDASNATRVLHYPRHNPNDVRDVELDTPCGKQSITPYHGGKRNRPSTPEPRFHTMDEYIFPVENRTSPMFMGDRGSACCSSMIDPTTGKKVLVAVVHPKTVFPGKNLPPGVVPNIYLSRFIAFESAPPYNIVARSGKFCLGYPNKDEESTDFMYHDPLKGVQMQPMVFGNDTYKCPRIHFVMGMVDKVHEEHSKVLLSYGVSDCKSRIVEIEKSEIERLLWDSENDLPHNPTEEELNSRNIRTLDFQDIELIRLIGKGEVSYGFEARLFPNRTVMAKIAADRDLHYSNMEIDTFQRLLQPPTIPNIPKIHGIIRSMRNPFRQHSGNVSTFLQQNLGLNEVDAKNLLSKRRISVIAMDFLTHRRPLPGTISELQQYMKSLLETLQFAHSRNIMHVDLHVGNIFWDGDMVHLFDWNAARVFTPETPQLIGNRVPPEAQNNENAFHASVSAFDLYTVGLLLVSRLLRHCCSDTKDDSFYVKMAHQLANQMMIADPYSRPNATTALQHPFVHSPQKNGSKKRRYI